MNKKVALVSGICLGASLMYVFDPDRGRSRRALARRKLIHAAKKTNSTVRGTVRDVGNRAYGLVAKAGSVLTA